MAVVYFLRCLNLYLSKLCFFNLIGHILWLIVWGDFKRRGLGFLNLYHNIDISTSHIFLRVLYRHLGLFLFNICRLFLFLIRWPILIGRFLTLWRNRFWAMRRKIGQVFKFFIVGLLFLRVLLSQRQTIKFIRPSKFKELWKFSRLDCGCHFS
jgi:hypothetical protein